MLDISMQLPMTTVAVLSISANIPGDKFCWFAYEVKCPVLSGCTCLPIVRVEYILFTLLSTNSNSKAGGPHFTLIFYPYLTG